MKRSLLLGSALLVAITAYPQNARKAVPSGVLESKFKYSDRNETSSQNASSAFSGPIKRAKSKLNNTEFRVSSVSSVTCNQFTGSMNVLGYLISQEKPLQFNTALNAISMIARKSSTYTASSNSNSGTIVGHWSTNFGASWDETCLWANSSNLARYPQGGIYNPLGNTNINNAYFVACGPFTSSAGGWGGTTNGAWYCSKQITTPGNTTPGSDQQSSYYQGGFLKSHYMSRYSFTAIDGGLVRSMSNIVNDPAGTTNATFGLRGALMVKGLFSAGTMAWSVDSFIPPVNLRSDGSPLIGTSSPIMAWDNTGTVGYVLILGSRTGTGPSTNGFQPIVYKTTTGGTSWSLLPATDFSDPACFTAVYDRLFPIVSNTNVICPNFAQSEGFDVTVDNNGNLHLVTMLLGHYSNDPDSLGFRYVFQSEQYSYGYSGSFDYPTIYDFYTRSSGGWDYHVVDSMQTEGPSGVSGQPGYTSNQWVDGSGGKMDLDARIQISRSDDGSKIFYSWTESDPSILSNQWNCYPDLKVRGFDVNTQMVTSRMNATSMVTNADQFAFYHYMSNKASGASSGCMDIPVTITYNTSFNGGIDVNTYYLDGIQLCASSFTIPAMSPKMGCTLNLAKENSLNMDVNAFPNPAENATTIKIGLKEAANIEVVLYNSVGQLIDTYKITGHTGTNEVNIDLGNYSSGVYFYNVKAGNALVTKKLVVQ